MRYLWLLVAALSSLSLAAPSPAATLTATSAGVRIDTGAFGRFVLSYPALDVGQAEPLKPIEQAVEGDKVTLKYASDVRVEVLIESDDTITYRFANAPAALKSYRMEMLIDFGFAEGGSWRMGGGDALAFPKDKPTKPHLYHRE